MRWKVVHTIMFTPELQYLALIAEIQATGGNNFAPNNAFIGLTVSIYPFMGYPNVVAR